MPGPVGGSVLEKKNQLAEAEALYREALEIRRTTFAPTYSGVARPLSLVGRVLAARGRCKEAIAFSRDALAIRRRGTKTPLTAGLIAELEKALADCRN